MTNAELKHLLGSAYVRFYIRPTFAMNYLGIKTPNETILRLEAYAKRKQLAEDMAFFEADASEAGDQ